jgi:hypothetical protein
MKQGTALVQCKCVNECQDKLHGTHTRVANTTQRQDKDFAEVRCTVCKTLHRVSPTKVR